MQSPSPCSNDTVELKPNSCRGTPLSLLRELSSPTFPADRGKDWSKISYPGRTSRGSAGEVTTPGAAVVAAAWTLHVLALLMSPLPRLTLQYCVSSLGCPTSLPLGPAPTLASALPSMVLLVLLTIPRLHKDYLVLHSRRLGNRCVCKMRKPAGPNLLEVRTLALTRSGQSRLLHLRNSALKRRANAPQNKEKL